MSGIAGIIQTDGSPVDTRVLERLVTSLAFRGPDGSRTRTDGSAGLCGAWLRVAAEGSDQPGPATLGGAWIVADARLDARDELISKLAADDERNLPSATDAQLILRAYERWGQSCVEHLIGDFAFAIWEGSASRLFCARDHFGVKPFYYANAGRAFIFSNTLDAVHLHAGVSFRPNDLAIADFLLFGHNQDPSTTSFADVHRLPPAHTLTLDRGGLHHRRYWTPSGGRIRYRRSRDYVEHFTELLQCAVSDRLGAPQVGVWMSGGVDSTAIATAARLLVDSGRRPASIRAHTTVYERLIPDDERHFAGLAAAALGIDIRFTTADALVPYLECQSPEAAPRELNDDPFFIARMPQLREASRHSRILLCGEGGDELLCPSTVVDLLARMPWVELGAAVATSVLVHRRRPAAGIRRRLLRDRANTSASFPSWLNDAFARRLNLRERWESVSRTDATGSAVRAEAERRLTWPVWPWYFECADPGTTHVLIEPRYPLLDVRLVAYMLAIPPLPWCIDKHLLRQAFRGLLPEAVRQRPKSALREDPLAAYFRDHPGFTLAGGQLGAETDPYVDGAAVPGPRGTAGDPWAYCRAHALGRWLREIRDLSSVRTRSATAERAIHEEAL